MTDQEMYQSLAMLNRHLIDHGGIQPGTPQATELLRLQMAVHERVMVIPPKAPTVHHLTAEPLVVKVAIDKAG